MKIIGVIPARFGSERLPGKPLIDIGGKPLIQRVYEQASRVKKIEKILVATDDERILNRVSEFGGEVILTSPECTTGSDRVAEVVRKVHCDIVVNIQGDELFFESGMVEEIIDALIKDRNIQVSTACVKIKNPEEVHNKNVVKVVFDKNNFALYFSRSSIPFFRGGEEQYFKHMGFYAFRKNFLLDFTDWGETFLEKAEKLEQLRILENGYRIKIIETPFDSLGIDTIEDVEKARLRLKGN